jgi:biopolymer transport protein ExbD
MARREVGEINAGSMADIAFLLLIFFLVTTTMEFDQGIAKMLPQKPPPDMPPVILLDRNVLTIQANFNDELMVDKEPLQITELKDKVIEFMKNERNDENLPEMLTVTKQSCEENIRILKENMEKNPSDPQFKVWESDVKDWEARRDALEAMKGAGINSFKVIPKLSVISVQTDNGTSYEYYIKIQDALKGAINFLRNEWSMKIYNVKYIDLKETSSADMEKIRVLRAIVPERIAEMEPRNIQEF